MKFRSSVTASKLVLNITPLIDVVFILLIFFAVNTSFVFNSAINVNLPQAETADDVSSTVTIRATLTDNNEVYIDGVHISENDLQAALEKVFSEKPGATLVIEADSVSQHGAVVKIIDSGRAAGFENFAIATDKEK